jgi:hypothetical protein
MKKLAILMVLALELAVAGCGTTTPTTTNTSTSGNWEAQLIGGTGEASKLNFITQFSVTNSGPLDFTSTFPLRFFNEGACFATPVNGPTTSESGTAAFTTNTATDQVIGTLTLTISSSLSANQLVLTSYPNGLTGTSNGTTTTTGTLTNGVVVGTWTLTGGAGDPSCNVPQGTFLMCQGAATCTAP